jgi:hypothetical protein
MALCAFLSLIVLPRFETHGYVVHTNVGVANPLVFLKHKPTAPITTTNKISLAIHDNCT